METIAYQRAPVVEAVLEFLFDVVLSKNDLERISKKLTVQFPRVQDQSKFAVAFSPTGVNINQSPYGYKLSSTNDLKIVILRPEGIAVSVLAPYSGWNELKSQGESVLKAANKVTGRRQIRRVGVRYINRLDIPSKDVDLSEWLNLQVAIPQNLGSILSEFSARVVVPSSDGLTTILSFATVPSPLADNTSVMLDIDVFSERDIPLADQEFWNFVDILRKKKNSVFENCVTDRMRQEFGSKEGQA